MGCGASSSAPVSEKQSRKAQILTAPTKSASEKATQLLQQGLIAECTAAEKLELRAGILADATTTRDEKAELLRKLHQPFSESELDAVNIAQRARLKADILASSDPLPRRAQMLAEQTLWALCSEEEKLSIAAEIRSAELSRSEKARLFSALPIPAAHVASWPDADREAYKQALLTQVQTDPETTARNLLASKTWELCLQTEIDAVKSAIMPVSTIPNATKIQICQQLGIPVDNQELAGTEKRQTRQSLLRAAVPIEKKVQQLITTGLWQACDPEEKEMVANQILANPSLSTLKKKELLEQLGVSGFLNLVEDTLASDEPIEQRADTLLTSGSWSICSPAERDLFKQQILQDDKLTKSRKEELFAVFGLDPNELPTEEKEILKFEILSQELVVEERLQMLLEASLWQFCLKTERERLKQELLTGPLPVDKKKDLFKRLGITVAAEELAYRISATSPEDEHKRQAFQMILSDHMLPLPEKAVMLKKFGIKKLTRAEEDRLLRVILFDSQHLEVKRELLSRYHIILQPEHKKKLKQFVLKSTSLPLDVKRSILIEFKLGALTTDEKETFRHQILQSTIAEEEKRLLLIEFQIIRDSEIDPTRRTVTPILGDDDEIGQTGFHPLHTGILADPRIDLEDCRQRIKGCLKVVKRDALRRRWEKECRVLKVDRLETKDKKIDEQSWAKWLGGHIHKDGDTERTLEVGSESICVKRLTISEHFYASEIGIRVDCKYRVKKTKHNTLCLVPEIPSDASQSQREVAKPLEYWLLTNYREIVLHVSKKTQEVVNDRTKGSESASGRGGAVPDPEELCGAAVSLLESDDERYVVRSGTLDYFTDFEYHTVLIPAVQFERSLLDFDYRADALINIPVQPSHTYALDGTSFYRTVLQLVNPPHYSMFIINTIVSEMKLDLYQHETSETFSDVLSLVNAVAGLGVPSPSSDQLRGEVGQLLFHRLMYTTTPKLLSKIRPLHDLIHTEFVQKVLRHGNGDVAEEDHSLVAASLASTGSVRKLFEKLLAGNAKVTAVISRSNFAEVLSLLQQTKHMATSVRVEWSNLESVLQTIDDLKSLVSLNFLFVRIVGQISITDLSRLVRHAADGSVRLVLINSGNLIQQLQLGGNLDSVYIADGITETSTLIPTQYNNALPVSRIINHLDVNEDIFLALDFRSEVKAHFLAKRDDWRVIEENRLLALLADDEDPEMNGKPSHAFAVIRTHDTPFVAAFYSELNIPGLTISIQDAKRGHFEQLQSAERYALVVLNSDLLSTIEKSALFERVLLEGSYLVLVTTRVSIDDLCYQPQQFKGLHSFHPRVIDAIAAEDETLLHCTELLDRMDELWSNSDILYVSVLFRTLRLVFGRKCSLEVLTEPVLVAMRCRAPEDVALIVNLFVKQAEGMLDPGIFNIYANNVEDFVSTVCAQADPDSIFEYPHQRDVDEPVSVADLAKLCQSYVAHCLRYSYDIDLPFDDFCHVIPACQFLSQRQRIKAWAVNVLGDVLFKETDIGISHVYNLLQLPDGNNTHSNYLLAYWVPAAWHKTHSSVPTYLRINSAEFELEELIVQRSTEMEELSWDNLRSRTFPKNLDFLMDLLTIYPYPLKILCSIAERKLFVNFLQVNNPRFQPALVNLARNITNCNMRSLLSHGTRKEGSDGMGALNNHLAVIRWCLFSSGALRDIIPEFTDVEGLNVGDEDIRRIIRLKLPFSAIASKDNRANAGATAERTQAALDNILRKICTFDLEEFLFKEVTFQRHLLRSATANTVLGAPDESVSTPLGAVLVHFIIHPIVSKGNAQSDFMRHPVVKFTQLLVEGKILPNFVLDQEHPVANVVNRMRVKFHEDSKTEYGTPWKTFLGCAVRFTPAAFATLVLKASQAKQSAILLWILELALQSKQDKEEYLVQVFRALENQQTSLQRYLFAEMVFRSDKAKATAVRAMRTKRDLTSEPEFNNALYCLSVNEETGQADVEFDPGRITGRVPLQHIPCLSPLFLKAFTDRGDLPVTTTANKLLAILSREAFLPLCKDTLRIRVQREAEGRQFENSLLLMLSWAMHPYESLDNLSESETKILLEIIRLPLVDFYEQVRRNFGGVSPLALFFVLPAALSFDDLEHFCKVFKRAEVSRITAIVCQDGVMYPPYLLRYPKGTKIPEELLEDLDSQLKDFVVDLRKIESLFKCYRVANSGVEVMVAEGATFKVRFGSTAPSSASQINVEDFDMPADEAKANNPILVEGVLLTITSVTGTEITAQVKKAGVVRPGSSLCFPYMNEKMLCRFKFNISSGVSAEIVRTNLEALLGTLAFKTMLCTCTGSTLCVNCATCVIVQALLWTWFICIGVTENRLRGRWLNRSLQTIGQEMRADPDGLWRRLVPDKDKTFAGYSTNLPFPSVVNTRYIVPSSAILFGTTEESRRKTVNYFAAFVPITKPTAPTPALYDELADKACEDLGQRTAALLQGPVDVQIVQHKKKGYDKRHVNLEPLMKLLNRFVELLLQLLEYIPQKIDDGKSRDLEGSYLSYIDRILHSFLRGLKRHLSPGDPQRMVKEAMAYRALFSLIGKPYPPYAPTSA
eukprot:TRINITY_DN12764_c0_g1_i3.p1 TRINITY_DN12764_c0_g1~~TRINITY_DN12764_c0_g1_i3.p1  ORF type:complete len:2547 (+),score=437.86 TRINITY_DN12764_c0_g1_i3:55-7695(+)